MVWQLLEFSLHYLQINALRKRLVSAILAETRCDREPEGESGALTYGRIAIEHLSDASAHRVRISAGDYIPPSDSSSAAARIAESDSSRSTRHCHSRRISNNLTPIGTGVSAQTEELRMR